MSFYLACDGMSAVGRSLLNAYEDVFRKVMSDGLRAGNGQSEMVHVIRDTIASAVKSELKSGGDDPRSRLAVIGASDYINEGTAERDAKCFVRENYYKFYDLYPQSSSKKSDRTAQKKGGKANAWTSLSYFDWYSGIDELVDGVCNAFGPKVGEDIYNEVYDHISEDDEEQLKRWANRVRRTNPVAADRIMEASLVFYHNPMLSEKNGPNTKKASSKSASSKGKAPAKNTRRRR